jgi:MFS family permease
MNARAVAIQRARGQAGISMFHAVYSIGGFLGAGIGGLFAGLGLGPTTTFVSVALGGLAITAVVWAVSKNVPAETAPAQDTTDVGDRTGTGDAAGTADIAGARSITGTGDATATGDATGIGGIATAGEKTGRREDAAVPGDAGRFKGLLFLGVLVFCCLVGEGAAADWSSVYLREDLHSAPGFAATAYAAFSLMMMAGRLVGDRLTAAVGPVRLVFGSGLVAAVGLGAGLLVDDPVGAVVGFGLFGAGLSCIAPQVFAAAGNQDPARAGSAIARVAGLGFLGFVVGPVVIGAVAHLVHLQLALGIPAVLALFVALSARAVAPSQSIVVGRERPTSGSIGGTLS